MRQLAAEVEFNRILEEKERRQIEQEIGKEKQTEEDAVAAAHPDVWPVTLYTDSGSRPVVFENEQELAGAYYPTQVDF